MYKRSHGDDANTLSRTTRLLHGFSIRDIDTYPLSGEGYEIHTYLPSILSRACPWRPRATIKEPRNLRVQLPQHKWSSRQEELPPKTLQLRAQHDRESPSPIRLEIETTVRRFE